MEITKPSRRQRAREKRRKEALRIQAEQELNRRKEVDKRRGIKLLSQASPDIILNISMPRAASEHAPKKSQSTLYLKKNRGVGRREIVSKLNIS